MRGRLLFALLIGHQHGLARITFEQDGAAFALDEVVGVELPAIDQRQRQTVGEEAELRLKIEDKFGLEYVAKEFVKTPKTKLVAARGDLYVEVDRPHDIIAALKLIIEKDPEACVGSRIFLSIVDEEVPTCADFLELAWLYDIGYREMMLCDEICLSSELLPKAIKAWDSFRQAYVKE